MDVCQRFRADGSPCTNPTDHADGWCRQADCPGFQRADRAWAPETVGGPQGTARHVRESKDVRLVGLDLDDVPDVRITVKALDAFRFHHGGDAAAAEVQLRSMLEDFLVRSARSTSPKGFWTLAREGFVLVISPGMDAVVGYRTVHRERTWEQVKAGVPSRISSKKREPWDRPAAPRPEPGPPVALADFLRTIDPQTVTLTVRVRMSFVKVTGSPDKEWTDELDGRIRDAFGASLTGAVHQRDDGMFEVVAQGLVWLVSEDCRSLVGVKRPKQPGAD